MTVNVGLCAGGPLNGNELASSESTVVIPVTVYPTTFEGWSSEKWFDVVDGQYVFHRNFGMWLWVGQWPPRGDA